MTQAKESLVVTPAGGPTAVLAYTRPPPGISAKRPSLHRVPGASQVVRGLSALTGEERMSG
jgi:hypothetical protein